MCIIILVLQSTPQEFNTLKKEAYTMDIVQTKNTTSTEVNGSSNILLAAILTSLVIVLFLALVITSITIVFVSRTSVLCEFARAN